MKKYIFLFVMLLVISQLSVAQTFEDGFRLSFHQVTGTARSAGMGNAFGALGGDFTSLSINPAGSAIYRNNEFVITPGYYMNKSELNLGGNTFSDNEQTLVLNNIGVVGTFNTNRSEVGIVSVNYGIGYNRLANFNSNAFANYDQSSVSYLDDITNYANSEMLSNNYLNRAIAEVEYRDWPTKLAWNTYLIDPASDGQGGTIDGQYVNILFQDEKVNQQKTYFQDGYLDEYVFNVSLNFNHNFYLGTTIGVHDIQFSKKQAYEETFTDDSFRFNDEFYMDGQGFNFKIGAIYKPVQSVRLGLAYHSPTWYNINDESLLGMDSYLAENYSEYGINYYNYKFNSPMKVVFSGAVLFGKKGLVSVDAEYMDYSNMRFREGGNGTDNFNDLNSEMVDVFDNVFNLHVGGEFKLTDQFALRAGYEQYGNPFKNNLDAINTLTNDVSKYSLGFGYMVNAFSLNVAYVNSVSDVSENSVQPNYYEIPRTNTNQNILLTLGFRF